MAKERKKRGRRDQGRELPKKPQRAPEDAPSAAEAASPAIPPAAPLAADPPVTQEAAAPEPVAATAPIDAADSPPPATVPAPETATPAPAATQPVVPAPPGSQIKPIKSGWQRWFPDIAKTALALAVIAVAIVIWYQPPLVAASFPHVVYVFSGEPRGDARLLRPLAMPTRYYVELPHKLAGRYQWFAVDRRREIVALAEPPRRHMLGRPAIRRSDPLGLDLEFRKIDGSEWQIAFSGDAIAFSNAVLAVRLETATRQAH